MTTTAATRTRLIRRALRDAGSTARVTSSPGSHRAQMTTVDQVEPERLAATAEHLSQYLGNAAEVQACEGFVSVVWNGDPK